jgi:hypothetical protein
MTHDAGRRRLGINALGRSTQARTPAVSPPRGKPLDAPAKDVRLRARTRPSTATRSTPAAAIAAAVSPASTEDLDSTQPPPATELAGVEGEDLELDEIAAADARARAAGGRGHAGTAGTRTRERGTLNAQCSS